MCGIVYAKSFTNNPINNIILQQYNKQRNRGRQGFGVFDMQFRNMVKTPNEDKILSWLKHYPANELLFHHRYPTSTENVKNAAHPFSTKDYFGETQYVLVHNGVLWNEDKLADAHWDAGIEYSSMQPNGQFNDSEALLWDVALYLEGQQDELKAQGSIAFICLALNEQEGDKLYFARNTGSPLNMYFTKKRLVLASEGKGQVVTPNQLYKYDYKTGQMSHSPFDVPEYHTYTPVASGGYPYREEEDDFSGGYFNSRNTDTGWYDVEGIFHPYSETQYEEEDDEFRPYPEHSTAEQGIDDPKQLANDIKECVKEYLTYGEGYYELAYGLLGERIEKLAGLPYDFRHWYEQQVLEGAKITMYSDPFWDKSDQQCRHYSYAIDGEQLQLPAKATIVQNSGLREAIGGAAASSIGNILLNRSDDIVAKVAQQYQIREHAV